MWINRNLVVLVALASVCSALDTSDKSKVTPGVMQIVPKDAVVNAKAATHPKEQALEEEKDLKTDATVTHTEPAPEFYRGVSADRADRYGTGSDYQKGGSWLSLDKESLYKNPYIANAYNKLASGVGSSTPSVSSLVSPNASYKDRYEQYSNYPTSNDFNKYGYGSTSAYGSYSGAIGAPYGPAQSMDYNHYSGSSSGYGGYSKPSYNHNALYAERDPPYYNKFGAHGGDYLSSKFGKSSILPLAGAALLGVAATLVANPLLLNFGVGVGKRRRRSVEANKKLRAKYLGQELAYRGQRV